MHAYIRALGFSKDVSFREMETIIRAGLGTAAEGGRLHVLEDKKKVFYRVPLGMDYGISVVCDYDDRDSDNPYILDYYTPYLIPEVNKKVDNLYIERHVANDSYGVLCDEIKDDATIVTFLDNAYEMKSGTTTTCRRHRNKPTTKAETKKETEADDRKKAADKEKKKKTN